MLAMIVTQFQSNIILFVGNGLGECAEYVFSQNV